MAGEVYVGKLGSGHMIIGELDKSDDGVGGERVIGFKNTFMVMLVPDPENPQRIAVQMKSMFWPIADEGAAVDISHIISFLEVKTADLIQEYVRTKTGGKLDIITGPEAGQVMSQLNNQMRNAQSQGIIKE